METEKSGSTRNTDPSGTSVHDSSVIRSEAKTTNRYASAYGEWLRRKLRRFGRGDSDVARTQEFLLGGAPFDWKRDSRWIRALQLRANASQTRYPYANASEWFVAPGLHARLHKLAGMTVEYVHWEFDGSEVVDRIEWILHGYF